MSSGGPHGAQDTAAPRSGGCGHEGRGRTGLRPPRVGTWAAGVEGAPRALRWRGRRGWERPLVLTVLQVGRSLCDARGKF